MTPLLLRICGQAAAAAVALALSLRVANASPDPMRVLVQGSSAADMRKLVEDNNGVVTHDLHIIDAVGATISRENLDNVLESPLVGRHIDDLSISEQPDPDAGDSNEACDVGGSLDLEITGAGFRWLLYNKKNDPARLSQLNLSWPAKLGSLAALQLGPEQLNLPPVAANDQTSSLELVFEDTHRPRFTGVAALTARFGSTLSETDAIPEQRAFSLKATFAGGCETKLIPGYSNNQENTYYPTVVGADALHKHGVTGRGVTVAILDSGLWEHETLVRDTRGKNRVIARYNAITNEESPQLFDESGHGTHMASILAQSGPVMRNSVSTGSYKGVAPDARLVVVKAFNVEGQGDFLDIIRGIQYVVDHRESHGTRVLNLSFASPPRWRYWLDPINQAVMRAWASGITVVAAAGNEGPDPMTIGSPGNLPYVITVGAVTDSWTVDSRHDDYIPDFSSRGPTPDAHVKPDIVAPGGHMTGLTRPGSTLTRLNPEYSLRTGEYVMTGSSQASALVSGIVALLLQLEPDLSPDDIKCKLITSAELAINRDGRLAYSPFQQGNGYASATRAITLGRRGCGNAGLDIEKDIQGIAHFQGPAIIDAKGEASLPHLGEMLSTEEPEQGLSNNRRWGAKGHIEREDYQWSTGNETKGIPGFDWESIYLQEKARVERLAETPPEKHPPLK